MAFHFEEMAIPGIVHIKTDIFSDGRGFFAEVFKQSKFVEMTKGENLVQLNHSYSKHGVLRGLHYQLPPQAQGKLVVALAGEIFDVAVDMRKSSPTFGQWVSQTLSAKEQNMLYVPEGFAHGFYVVSESADVFYGCTKEYAPVLERGVKWNDPKLDIAWPVKDPVVSDKDAALPVFEEAENPFA